MTSVLRVQHTFSANPSHKITCIWKEDLKQPKSMKDKREGFLYDIITLLWQAIPSFSFTT